MLGKMKIATVATTEITLLTIIEVYDELVAKLGAVPDLLIVHDQHGEEMSYITILGEGIAFAVRISVEE